MIEIGCGRVPVAVRLCQTARELLAELETRPVWARDHGGRHRAADGSTGTRELLCVLERVS